MLAWLGVCPWTESGSNEGHSNVDAQDRDDEREESYASPKEGARDSRLGAAAVRVVRGRDYATLVVALIVMRGIVIGWGFRAAQVESIDAHDYQHNYHHHRLSPRLEEPRRFEFFELWTASDAQWYLSIADSGYPSRDEFDDDDVTTRPKLIVQTDTQLKYAFFPLWPGVIRAVDLLFKNAEAAGVRDGEPVQLDRDDFSLPALATEGGRIDCVLERDACSIVADGLVLLCAVHRGPVSASGRVGIHGLRKATMADRRRPDWIGRDHPTERYLPGDRTRYLLSS